jgi:hypothetical protein
MQHKPVVFIRELMKDKPEKEISGAEENFREYLMVVKEIADRLENDQNLQNNEDSV